MTKEARLSPTADQTYEILFDRRNPASRYDFRRILLLSYRQEEQGDAEAACNTRYAAFQDLYALIPDDEEIELSWEDDNSQAALMLLDCSAIDHFLIGDWEMCAGMWELLLELDPEDHLEATVRLAYAYLAAGDYESFDEVINDVSDKHVDKVILALWSEQRRAGRMSDGDLLRFKRRFGPYYDEFVADEHPVTEGYVADIRSGRPSRESQARELWLQTEHLWRLFPDFIEGLKKVGNR